MNEQVVTHWNNPRNRAPHETHDLEDSIPYPFACVENLIIGDVLEIGPGRGRQYERLKDAATTYSICDIAPNCLDELVFDAVANKLLLVEYSDDFGLRFDVVHFWYVLHHVRSCDIDAFFSFVARHLRPNGIVLFNSPQVSNDSAWYADDGMGTTRIGVEAIMKGAKYLEFFLLANLNVRSTGHIFGARKPHA